MAIEFDEAAARGVEHVYKTPDVVAQRARFLEALALRPGEQVLDVGVGPGLLASDMANQVGENGLVAGIDASEAMVAMSRRRCADQGCTRFRVADATQLPFEDAHFDAVVSTQAYEYVPDMTAALAEAFRVLRPGGRCWILDTDWASAVWHTADHARMRRVLDAWEAHLHDPHLPATLRPRLVEAGFRVVRQEVIPLLNTTLHAHTYSFGMLAMIQGFVAGRDGITPEEAQAWGDEQRDLAAADAYFFSLNRYLVGAVKP